MTTDDINPVFDDYYSNDDPDSVFELRRDPVDCGYWDGAEWFGGRRDKNVGNTDIYTTNDDQTLNIEVNDAYPCYYSHVLYKIRNKGSCPALIHAPLMLEELSIQTDPTDPATHHIIDIKDMELTPNTWYYIDIFYNENQAKWKAKIKTDVTNPEKYDFSLYPTGNGDINMINLQLDPWDWLHGDDGDIVAQHMEDTGDYYDEISADLCVHFENGCLQNTIYDFKFGMTFWNWPEFCTPQEPVTETYPEDGNVYFGYEDWGNGDFDYNDFGMYFNTVETYLVEGDDWYLTNVLMTFKPQIYDSGGNHNIHITRDLVGNSQVVVTRTIAASGAETPDGIHAYSGDVDVFLFDTAKYPQPSKQIYTNTGEMVTVEIIVGEPYSNPKVALPAPGGRYDVDPFLAPYDPWEVGTSGVINGVDWHIEDMQTVASTSGGGAHGADPRLVGLDLPYILVVPSTDWIPPYESTCISGPLPYGPYQFFYDYYSTDGVDHPTWYDECTNNFVGYGYLSWGPYSP